MTKEKRRLKFWATEMASRAFVLLMFALALSLFALGLYLLPREVRVVDQHDGMRQHYGLDEAPAESLATVPGQVF